MATPTVSEAFVTQYDDQVHITYQRQGAKLIGTTRKKPGVVGQIVTFQRITTEAEAEEKSRHGDIPTQELTHSPTTLTIANYYAAFYADEDDIEKLNIDERMALSQSGAWCIGRKHDSLIITAMDTTTNYVGVYASNVMTIAIALGAFDKLNSYDVPDDGDRYAAISPHAYAELMCYQQFANADWIGADGLPWKSGLKFKDWLGVRWLPHSGLPLTGDDRTNFMWHKSALGWGENKEISSRIEWDVRKDAWLIKHKIAGAAALIDAEGVCEMRCDDDTAITTETEKMIAALGA